jgi:hypothetical protein
MAETEKADQSIAAPKFYAAILHADGTYNVEEFETLDLLVARVKGLVDRDVSVFSFAGTRLQISKPPFRHLLTPWGPQPLFDPPGENLEPDDSGYLGLDPTHLEDPPEVKQPSGPNRSSTPTNEFFSDDDENVVNVFDNILPDPDS